MKECDESNRSSITKPIDSIIKNDFKHRYKRQNNIYLFKVLKDESINF